MEKEHYGLEGLRTLDLNVAIKKTETLVKKHGGMGMNGSDMLIASNQAIIMQALVDIINEMQKPKIPTTMQK